MDLNVGGIEWLQSGCEWLLNVFKIETVYLLKR